MALKPAFTCCSCLRKSASVASYFNDRSTPVSLRALIPDNARAVSRGVLLGTVPVLIPAPPSSRWLSTRATVLCEALAVAAPTIPAGPPPMIIKSYILVSVGIESPPVVAQGCVPGAIRDNHSTRTGSCPARGSSANEHPVIDNIDPMAQNPDAMRAASLLGAWCYGIDTVLRARCSVGYPLYIRWLSLVHPLVIPCTSVVHPLYIRCTSVVHPLGRSGSFGAATALSRHGVLDAADAPPVTPHVSRLSLSTPNPRASAPA